VIATTTDKTLGYNITLSYTEPNNPQGFVGVAVIKVTDVFTLKDAAGQLSNETEVWYIRDEFPPLGDPAALDNWSSTFPKTRNGKTVCGVTQTNEITVGVVKIVANSIFDRNGDGTVTATELQVNVKMTEAEAKKMLSSMQGAKTATAIYEWTDKNYESFQIP
jgi:hypothetical protein